MPVLSGVRWAVVERCVFCEIVAGQAPASRVFENERFIAFMDIHPVRPGHVLVCPRDHAQRVAELSPEMVGDLFALGSRLASAIRRSEVPCDDVNFLLNDGPAANQTVPHVHLHLIPRVAGDLLRLVGMALRRPFEPLFGPRSRDELDRVAAEIRAAL